MREQATLFNQETIVIHTTLFIYSCVTNVTQEIISKRHQTNYDLDLIIIKGASETTEEASWWLFISTNLIFAKKLRCVFLRGDIKMTTDRLICEKTFIHKLKTHSKGLNQNLSFTSPYSYFHPCRQLLTSTSINNTEV